MTSKRPNVVDQYLARLGARRRAALERLRRVLRAAAPGAEECLSYGLPALRLGHKRLVAYGATPRHCALYPLSRATLAAFARELEDFDVSTGAIRFQPDEPLPPGLVRRIVQARIREDEPL